MIYLLPIFLCTISYLLGNLIQKVIGDTKSTMAETFLIGFLSVILFWEVLVLPSIKLLAPFDVVCRVFSILLLIFCILSLVVARKNMLKQLKIIDTKNAGPLFSAIFIIGLQIVFFFLFYPDVSMDFTAETVNTTLVSNLIYENHPGMGDTFTYGITFRGKIVTLPVLYAYFLQLLPGETTTLLYRMIPIVVLLLNASVYWLWGHTLFVSNKDNSYQAYMFVVGIGLLNICGSFAKNCIFYYQMYRGFRGETIVYTVLIPYGIYLCMQIFGHKKYRSILYLVMSGLASLCVCDYQKGFLPFVISVLFCFLIAGGYQIRRCLRWRK
ncbi:MAG: DUF6077 domain-containing protein [Lachnospiraceae bacterium]